MRFAVAVLLGLVTTAGAPGQDKDAKVAPRFGIQADMERFPQGEPKEALASVLKAVQAKKYDYLLAHLADPAFVDMRVKLYGGNFDELVKETAAKFAQDPTAVKELGRFLKEGQWEVADASASAQLKDVKDRRVFLRKADGRWFLENKQKPTAEK